MQVIVIKGENAHVLLKRERKLDTEFDQVVLQTIDTTHPEDFNTLKFFWETFSKE